MKRFIERFRFQPERHLYVGIERECFLTRGTRIVPIAAEVLAGLEGDHTIGYELSACQLEYRIGPCPINQIKTALVESDRRVDQLEKAVDFKRQFLEVAPDDMPLDVYPDPAGRYGQIAKRLSPDQLLAACQITGTHIHIGMANACTAMRVYNGVVDYWQSLYEMGNGSNGRRLERYKVVCPDCTPCPHTDWEDFCHKAKSEGFYKNPRNCWRLIRISVHGTIEFRLFGPTDDLSKIEDWAKECHRLCKEAE